MVFILALEVSTHGSQGGMQGEVKMGVVGGGGGVGRWEEREVVKEERNVCV